MPRGSWTTMQREALTGLRQLGTAERFAPGCDQMPLRLRLALQARGDEARAGAAPAPTLALLQPLMQSLAPSL